MAKNIDDLKLSYRRKVRFELPNTVSIDSTGSSNSSLPSSPVLITVTEHRPVSNVYSGTTGPNDKRNEIKVHGTGNYVNGTLNLTSNDITMMPPINKIQSTGTNSKPMVSSELKAITTFRNQFTNEASAKNVRKNCSIDQQYWDNAVHRRGILIHVSAENQSTNHIKFRNNKINRYASILMKPSNCLKRSSISPIRLFRRSKTSNNTSNTLELPTLAQQQQQQQQQSNKPQSKQQILKRNPFERFSYKLTSIKKPADRMRTQVNCMDNDDDDEHDKNTKPPTVQSVKPTSSVDIDFDARALSIVKESCCALNKSQCEAEHHCSSQNLSEILQNLNRWQCMTTTAHTMPINDNQLRGAFNHSVEFCTLKKLDVKQ